MIELSLFGCLLVLWNMNAKSAYLWNTQVFLVAKDFGARVAQYFALLYPNRVAGVVTLGIPFVPPKPTPMQDFLPEGFYMSRWLVHNNLCF